MRTSQNSNWKKRIYVAAMAIIAANSVFAQATLKKDGCISGNCQEGYGVYVDEDGNRYAGFFSDGDYNGFGSQIYNGGDMYIGTFLNGYRNGQGVYTWAENGAKYIGHWENGMRQGIGTSYYDDGSSSTDIWDNDDISEDKVEEACLNGDCRQGYGVAIWKDGSMYEGNFNKGNIEGQGKLTEADGSFYEGEFLKGYYSGYGILTNPDGTTQNGLWEKGRFIGEVNPKNMKGCISGNCENGYGVYIYDNEGYYLGDFKNGVSHGQGAWTTPGGEVFRGSFENDEPSGFIFLSFTENDEAGRNLYVGDCLNGKITGYGALTYKDGSVAYGHYVDGKLNGEGVIWDASDQSTRAGIWKNGEFQSPKDEKDFKLIYGDKNAFGIRLLITGRYTGNLKDGMPEGQGMLQTYNGLTVVGQFKNGDANGQGMVENRQTGARYIGELTNGTVTGNGTIYYADGTTESGYFVDGELQKEKPADTKVAKPEVSWTAPQYFNTETTDGKMTVKLCVTSKTPLSEVIVSVNGQIQVKKALSRGFSVVTSDCDYPLEYEITLAPGKNTIEATVKNEGGAVTTDPRYVTLNKSDQVSNQKRVALVIGNADYQNITKLNNSANDAKLMAETLKKLGFEVMEFENLSRKDMSEHIYEFGDKLKETNAVGLFYYAGHGLQVNGVNYLVPVTATVQREQEVEDECVSLDKVLGQLEYAQNDLNIIILDACRNNPFPKVSRAVGNDGGLAQVSAPKGTFVAYATAPGKTASDGTGSNGLYTEKLAKAIMTPGEKIEDVFKDVRNNVYNESKQMGTEQIPWENSSIFGDFYFVK